jgi:membrane-associated phospholipid phosphatase
MTVDLPLARSLVQGKALHQLHGMLAAFEPFGQPTAILVIAAAFALCDVRRRALMPRLLAAALGSGLVADVVKLFVSRTRPHHHDLAGSVLATFEGLLPGFGVGSPLQSCPSAHTATGVGFCLALWTLFPAGRWLFVAAATLVAAQRVETGAHYLSDACWGAAVGYAVCLVLFRPNLLGGWFDRKEQAWSRRDNQDRNGPVRERLSIVTRDGDSAIPR